MSPIHRQLSQVIGIDVDVGSITSLADHIVEIAKTAAKNVYICVANVHMLTIARSDPHFSEVLKNASLVVPDGMPLVWTQKKKGFAHAQRVSGPDLMLHLCELAVKNHLSIYLLGASSETLKLLSENLLQRFPNLKIIGTHSPAALPEKPKLDGNLVERINQSGASILFVGLGCPKQEYWCSSHAPNLNAVAIGVGAAFDFHAGTKKRPPLWVQQSGMEWLYRLLSEPRRLWKRYLTSNTAFICYSLLDLVKRK
jgi:N-acetylglucosaminyldiphosphoundecaprenol N-acetyl-beta-D-mannosaminyltransferase